MRFKLNNIQLFAAAIGSATIYDNDGNIVYFTGDAGALGGDYESNITLNNNERR